LRDKYFGNKVFLYGFIYFSTFCRNNCSFCYFRRQNRYPQRYRKTEQEVIEAAERLRDAGVHLIDLTMGEDPFYSQFHHFEQLIELVQKIKKSTGLALMISPGVLEENKLRQLVKAGVDWYACYQETYNRELFRQLRVEQDFDVRIKTKQMACKNGLLIEDGILVGVGETTEDLAFSLKAMIESRAQQIRVMSFVPQKGTPFENLDPPSRLKELVSIALMRILSPQRLIPASLDVDGVKGLKARLQAGANVVTSLIPPEFGLAGVARVYQDIDEGYRTVAGIKPILKEMKMEIAPAENYFCWLKREKENLSHRIYASKIGR